MGASVGRKGKIVAEINVVPLVDIVLVLLIIFMVTASFVSSGMMKFQLPKAAKAGDELPTTINVVLDKDGNTFVNGAKIEGAPEGVVAIVQRLAANKTDVTAAIAADKRVSHGQVIALIDAIKTAGVENFAFSIEKTAR